MKKEKKNSNTKEEQKLKCEHRRLTQHSDYKDGRGGKGREREAEK